MVVGLVLRHVPSQVSVAVKIRTFEGDAVLYRKVSNPSTTLWGDNSNTTLFIGTPSTSGSFGTDFPTSVSYTHLDVYKRQALH